ncbi:MULTISPECIES: RidA family protein [Helicobacter]|uniref:RidA family protein n=1 Tax=Helicobacter TaxID=209 RepID=UPI00047CB98D|nr:MULTISPECIES: RidA family protein [Helicobacter]MDY5556235.1 RidA family protein [Helicobacter sp.]
MLEIIATQNAPQAIGPYSQAIKANGVIYTSGQIGLNPQGILVEGIEAQTRQVLNNLSEVLKAGGSSLQQVFKTTIFLSNMEDFALVNAIYAEFFGEHKPARSTVAVKTLPKNALVEIECMALAE